MSGSVLAVAPGSICLSGLPILHKVLIMIRLYVVSDKSIRLLAVMVALEVLYIAIHIVTFASFAINLVD